MSAAPNLTAFTYWPGLEPHLSETPPAPYPTASFLSETHKSKFLRQSMLFFNNISPKQESFSEHDNTNEERDSKHFLTPLNAVQFSESQTVKNEGNGSSSNKSEKARPYYCEECGKSFLLKHHLTTHAMTHSGIRPHVCTHCGKSFTHKHCLNTHLLLHSSERPFQCGECKKSFTLKHHLITHSKVHSRAKPFICNECGQAFPVKRHLTTHAKFHAGERPFICEECGESFAQKNHLVMHSRFHGSLNSFVCHDCGATFTRKFELVNHARLHGKQPHLCTICNREFFQKRTLIAHMRCHSDDFRCPCASCGESFRNKHDLNIHLKNCCNTNNKGHIIKQSCDSCGCCFNTPEALALHIKLHSGDSSLVNDLCILTSGLQHSSFPLNLQNQSDNNNKAKKYSCEHCTKNYSTKHGLQQHIKRHPDGGCALKSYVCHICSKAFYQKNHLLLHQRQHMDPSERNKTKV